ncbi:hypothetical protein B0T16DRAFT_154975 [Cercophora newfieldiana]|uniref:Uncharacterized protein n=1 Tax=Cercophora newfieldiana TaxID=92897 RepID=A0AA40CPE4_9PEZI|nr:hypothetical protein B0T16DRAFT_154975 [Cercophora newfieldiana]
MALRGILLWLSGDLPAKPELAWALRWLWRRSLSSLTARDLLLIPGLFTRLPPPTLKLVTSGTTETHRLFPDPQILPAASVGLGVAVDGPELPTTPSFSTSARKHTPARARRRARHPPQQPDRPDDNTERQPPGSRLPQKRIGQPSNYTLYRSRAARSPTPPLLGALVRVSLGLDLAQLGRTWNPAIGHGGCHARLAHRISIRPPHIVPFASRCIQSGCLSAWHEHLGWGIHRRGHNTESCTRESAR